MVCEVATVGVRGVGAEAEVAVATAGAANARERDADAGGTADAVGFVSVGLGPGSSRGSAGAVHGRDRTAHGCQGMIGDGPGDSSQGARRQALPAARHGPGASSSAGTFQRPGALENDVVSGRARTADEMEIGAVHGRDRTMHGCQGRIGDGPGDSSQGARRQALPAARHGPGASSSAGTFQRPGALENDIVSGRARTADEMEVGTAGSRGGLAKKSRRVSQGARAVTFSDSVRVATVTEDWEWSETLGTLRGADRCSDSGAGACVMTESESTRVVWPRGREPDDVRHIDGGDSAVDAKEARQATFSSNKLVRAARATRETAAFPKVNHHEPRGPLGEPPVGTPPVRPLSIPSMFEPGWFTQISEQLAKCAEYERSGRAKKGRGTKRPDDLIIPDEALRPQYRGFTWYFIDHLRDSTAPIITVQEASWTRPTLNADQSRAFGDLYGDEATTERLIAGHRDESACERVTVISPNHAGTLEHWCEVNAAFEAEVAEDVGWLLGPLSFLPVFPCRVEPCGAVQQGDKVRITTDKSWPRNAGVSSVNGGIDMHELGTTEFCSVADFTKAVAIIRTIWDDGHVFGEADDKPHSWKVDLTAAYRQLHIHPSDIWKRAKSWCGKCYLDVRGQFGDASQVKSFQDITDMIVTLVARATAGDPSVRSMCTFMTDEQWAALDERPPLVRAWMERREEAGLSGADLVPCFLQGYLDDYLGCAWSAAMADAQCDLTVGILSAIGFPLKPSKTVRPARRMEALGADIDLETEVASLAATKARHYQDLVEATVRRRFSRFADFRSLVSKLVYAAQYTPVGRAWLTCCFSALTEAERRGSRVRLGGGVKRELRWWLEALPESPGVAFFPAPGVLDGHHEEYFFDASTSWGAGGACVTGGVCYYWQHRWSGPAWHINVGEAFAGYASLRLFSAAVNAGAWLEHGDNKVANASARRGATPNRRIAEILRNRGLFIATKALATQQVYVNTLENKMADPLSRGDNAVCMDAFRAAARARGATRFVKLNLDAHLLAIEQTVSDLGTDGDDPATDDDESEASGSDVESVISEPESEPENPSFGLFSGFAGIDTAAMVAAELGGTLVAAFDWDEMVREVHDRLYPDVRCWGSLQDVAALAATGRLRDVVESTFLYTAGTPCPDWSQAGLQLGAGGIAGGELWAANLDFIVDCMFPAVLLEQVTGILEVDGGRHFWDALQQLRDAGYLVRWSVQRCQRHGDATTRRRVFVVAIQPQFLREGVHPDELKPPAMPAGCATAQLAELVDEVVDEDLIYTGSVRWVERQGDDPSYDGPQLLGVIGQGGIGHHVYAPTRAVTQKTWGEGPGGATGLYRFEDGTVRALSATESFRAHSFPDTILHAIQHTISPTELQHLVGNSIPYRTMRAMMAHVLSLSQIPQARSGKPKASSRN